MCGRCDRLLDSRCLRDVATRAEDGDERRLLTGAEGLQRALVRLVRRVPGDREALEPALRHLRRREGAEEREHDPRADHEPAVPDDLVCEGGEHLRPGYASPYSRRTAVVQSV